MATPVAVLTGVVLASGGVAGLGVASVALSRDHPAAGPMGKWAGLAGLAGLCFAGLVVVPRARGLLALGNALLMLTVGYYLLFVLAYTGREEWLTRWRRRAVLGLFGVATLLSVSDTLFLRRMTVETHAGLTYPHLEGGGVVYLVLLVFVLAVLLVGLALLGGFLISSRNMYRKQTALITAAIALSVVVSLLFQAGLSPHPGLNLTSVFYVVEASLIGLALFRYEFLNVEPLAPEIVLEQVTDPVIVLDEGDRVVDANPAALALFDRRDPVGVPVNDLLPGLLGAAAKDEAYRPPGTDPDADGSPVEVYDLNRTPITDQYDRDRGTVVVLRDVTVQKRRERTLESLQSVSQRFLAAESVEEVFDIAVTAADELLEYPYSGAMVYDEEANVLRPVAFADALVAAYEEADGSARMVVEPGDTDVWRVFESGEPMLGEPIETGGGGAVPVDIGGSLLYPLGEYGVLGISAGPDHEGFSDDDRRFADILASTTENALDRVEKERQLRESRELLARSNEQLGFFNSVLRHDLLNGMQVVQGRLDLLADTVDDDARDHVAVIDRWIDDIMSLTRNVRAVTRTVSGEQRVELRAVDLGGAVGRKAGKVRDAHEAVTVDVLADLDDLPAVRADDFLAEVVENLLVNAIEHNDRDHTAITVDAVVGDETVRLRIADNGPGVDDERKEEIFEESVTSEDSGSVGFGLYFVRVMVEQYGGDVWFEDRDDWSPPEGDEDRGVVAVVELRRADADTRQSASAASTDD